MDRKAWVAVILAIGTMMVWQWYSGREYQKAAALARAQAAEAAAAAAARGETPPAPTPPLPASTATAPAQAPAAQAATAPATPETPEHREEVATPFVDYVFTTRGGGIAEARMLKHPLNDGFVSINSLGGRAIGALLFDPLEPAGDWTMEVKGRVVTARRDLPNGLAIAKRFALPLDGVKGKDEYLVSLDVEFANRGPNPFETSRYLVATGALGPLHPSDLPTYTGFDWLREGKLVNTMPMWFDPGRIPLLGIETRAARSTYDERSDKVAWAGVKNQYFASIVSPDGRVGVGGWARRLDFSIDNSPALQGLEGALAMPGFKLAPGETSTAKFTLWVGPREFTRLKQLKQDEDRIMNFGMFRIVSELLLSAMHWLKGLLGSYAVAIIVLTILIKLGLWPMQNASTQSAKKMQLLSPHLKALQEKYKDDPVRAQQEYSKLLKEYGVNPLGGCLPLLATIPIFFGFFWMLGQAIELRGSEFFWVKDLSQPDTLFRIAGFPVNILPLVMAGTSFWQMALMPKTGDPVQQRIFMFMPLIFIAFCYNFASALSLYYTVQNLFSIFQLYVTRNQPMPKLEKVAAPAAARGGKPRKRPR